MFLSNFVGLANASEGHDPISKGIAIVSAAFRVCHFVWKLSDA